MAVSEISGLDPAFVDYGAKAVVGFAEAQVQPPGHLALRDFGVFGQEAEDVVAGGVVHLRYVLRFRRFPRSKSTSKASPAAS